MLPEENNLGSHEGKKSASFKRRRKGKGWVWKKGELQVGHTKKNLANLPLGSGQKSASRLDIHDMTVGEWVRGEKSSGVVRLWGEGVQRV